ncbi:MAG: caspase family protein [Nitrospirota bacterium]|nr:caspase family protein [Nitrospirota bacterium]MDP2381615.1 caspase family protein [Nitrospirota bacterium]
MLPIVSRAPRHFLLAFLSCLLLALVCLPSASAQLGKPEGLYYKSWAIIIGVENYLLAPKIPGAIEDAKAVAQAFRQLGFDEVVELYDKDASFRRLQQTLSDFLPRKVGRHDRLVLYFVGHAGMTQDLDGKELGYLVPWDAQIGNVSKSVTFEQLKEFSRRSASKHTLFLVNAAVRGWEVSTVQPLSFEGRLAPEDDTERRAVQLLTAGDKGESLSQENGKSVFVQVLVNGLSGMADGNKNGWLMASEVGDYVKQHVLERSKGTQHAQLVQLEGDGDTVLIEGRKAAYTTGAGPQSSAERRQAAKMQYEQAFALLQTGKLAEEALERLNKALEYDPTFGDAYVLKSYVLLEVIPNLDAALSTAELAVQYAPKNPDSQYTLGLIHEKRGQYAEAERAMQAALVVNPNYVDVYFSLGILYADEMKDQAKSVEAFTRYLELGGSHARARAAVAQQSSPAAPVVPSAKP